MPTTLARPPETTQQPEKQQPQKPEQKQTPRERLNIIKIKTANSAKSIRDAFFQLKYKPKQEVAELEELQQEIDRFEVQTEQKIIPDNQSLYSEVSMLSPNQTSGVKSAEITSKEREQYESLPSLKDFPEKARIIINEWVYKITDSRLSGRDINELTREIDGIITKGHIFEWADYAPLWLCKEVILAAKGDMLNPEGKEIPP